MNISREKILYIIIAILLAFNLLMLVNQNKKANKRSHHPDHPVSIQKMTKMLDLNEEQIQLLKPLRDKHMSEMKSLMEKRRALREQQRSLLENQQALNEDILVETLVIEGELERLRFQHIQKMRSYLNEQQLQKLDEVRNKAFKNERQRRKHFRR